MSEQETPREEKGKPGGKALLALLVVAAAAAAFYFYTAEKPQEQPAPVAEQAQPERRAPELPAFAPRPEAEADNATAQPPAAPQAEATPSVSMRAAEPQTDRVMTPDFIADLAEYLAAGYHPAGTVDNPSQAPMSTVTFKKLNMRYGVDLYGLDVAGMDPAVGRKQALDHLMSPIVLRLAYGLYGERLVQALTDAGLRQTRAFNGGERALSQAEVGRMLALYAALTRDVGRTFEIFASRRELVTLMNRYFQAVRGVNQAYADYADREAAGAPDKELDAISVDIKKAITYRESLRRELLRGAMPAKGSHLTEGDVLDIASWVSRRLTADPDAINAVGALAIISRELAQALDQAAKG